MAARMSSRKANTPLSWPEFKAMAMSLDLPHVTEAVSWGQPNLKAHGKMWCWWSPTEDAPVFKVSKDEREMLIELDPKVFFVTNHYRPHGLVLARPETVDRDWARGKLLQSWREMAPKKVLKAWEASQSKRSAARASD
jgi:hypothetical protein